jgi:hypothetical protein
MTKVNQTPDYYRPYMVSQHNIDRARTEGRHTALATGTKSAAAGLGAAALYNYVVDGEGTKNFVKQNLDVHGAGDAFKGLFKKPVDNAGGLMNQAGNAGKAISTFAKTYAPKVGHFGKAIAKTDAGRMAMAGAALVGGAVGLVKGREAENNTMKTVALDSLSPTAMQLLSGRSPII